MKTTLKSEVETLDTVIRHFRNVLGGKYGNMNENNDIETMLRAILHDIEKVKVNIEELRGN